MADKTDDLANFAGAFGLGTQGPNPYALDEKTVLDEDGNEVSIDVIADEISSNEGQDTSLKFEDAQDFLTGSKQPAREAADAPLDASTVAAPAGVLEPQGDPPEEGSRDWAMQLLAEAARGPSPSPDDIVDDGTGDESDRLRTSLAISNALLEEKRREEQLAFEAVGDEDEDEEEEETGLPEFDPSAYRNPEIVSQIQESYGVDEETAKLATTVASVMTQHYHENVIAPTFDQMNERIDVDQEQRASDRGERETLSNLGTAASRFKEANMELEYGLVEQLVKHGLQNSFVGQYFLRDDNRYLSTSVQGIVDATQTVARQVQAQAGRADRGVKTKTKRGPVGEQTFSTPARAARSRAVARSVARDNEANPAQTLRDSIRNAGRARIPALMGS